MWHPPVSWLWLVQSILAITAACLHYTWNDICVQMTQVYHFTVVASVEASSPLKVLSFIYCMSFFCKELQLPWTLFNVWAYSTMSLYQVTLFYMSFIQLQQWTECTMNDVEHHLMWTLWNYIIVKWFEWNFNKGVQKNENISSVIILLPSNPAQRLPWHSVELNQCPDALWHYSFWPWLVMIIHLLREYFFQCVFPRPTEIENILFPSTDICCSNVIPDPRGCSFLR